MPLRVYLPLWGFYVYAVLLSCKHHHHYNKTENPHQKKTKQQPLSLLVKQLSYILSHSKPRDFSSNIYYTYSHTLTPRTYEMQKKKNPKKTRKTSKIAVLQYKWIRQVLAIATVYSDESRTWTAFACWLHLHSRYSNESFKAAHCTGAFKSHVHFKKKRCFL